MKILMVAGTMHVGGLENQLMHLVRQSNREKFQFDFTSEMPDAFYRNEIEQLGGRFLVINNKSRNHPIKYFRELYKIMKEGNYDVVHAHELFHSGMTLFAAKLAGVPCRIAHAHSCREGNEIEPHYSVPRKIYHRVMRFLINRYSTRQIACSTWAGEFLYGKKKTKSSTYSLVYNSVDTSLFLEKYENTEDGEFVDADWKNVIFVARICALKNHIFLTEIAKVLKEKNEKIRFICVGDGDADIKEEFENAIKVNELEDYFILTGVRKDVDVLMRKASAFITPTRYEGMPLVMIEAQASGLPCVTADTYSREVDFEIGMVKWLSLADSVENWADAVEKAVETPRADKAKVEAAINKKGFDSKIFAKKICKIYEEDFELRGRK